MSKQLQKFQVNFFQELEELKHLLLGFVRFIEFLW